MMKYFRAFLLLALIAGFLFTGISCAVIVKSNNGNHKGWYKNPNNPHHPQSSNPGISVGKHKKFK